MDIAPARHWRRGAARRRRSAGTRRRAGTLGTDPAIAAYYSSRGWIVVSGSTAVGEAVLTHRDTLLRYLRAHGAGDHAEDLFQELWLKAQRLSPELQASRNYVMRMAHSMIVDHARSARQRGLRDDRWHVDGPTAGGIDPGPDAERTLIAHEQLRKVDEVLQGLGGRTHRILSRHRVEGWSQRRIAEEEALSLSAVEKHLQKAYRAVALVRLELNDDREDRHER